MGVKQAFPLSEFKSSIIFVCLTKIMLPISTVLENLPREVAPGFVAS